MRSFRFQQELWRRAMQCPNCKLENSFSSLKCSCGYVFEAKAGRTPGLSVKELIGIEARLSRAFFAAVAAFIIYRAISIFSIPSAGGPRAGLAVLLMIVLLFILAVAGYVWYVVSIYLTATAIKKPRGLYLFWAIGGPILSLLPIPIISIVLSVTPLTIKFLLSGEIRTMIRLQTLRDLH
jgi:hypothetical protein